MKKLFFILSILSIVFLFSFSKKSTYPPVKIQTKSGSCSIPTGLAAVKNGSQVTLSWSSDPVNCSYGGYFNTPNGYVTFGGSTNTWPITISCPSDAISINYSVTANCSDGSHTYSVPAFIYF